MGKVGSSLRRLHALTGAVPLTLFMLVQLVAHAKAVSGPQALGDALAPMAHGPRAGLWVAVVLATFGLHAALGLWRAVSTRPRDGAPGRGSALQRLSGLIALGYVAGWMGLVWMPLQRGSLRPDAVHELLAARLSSTAAGLPWVALAALIGLGALCHHATSGLVRAADTFELWPSEATRGKVAVAATLVGLAAFAFGARTTLYFATGWSMTPTTWSPPPSSGYCTEVPVRAAPSSSGRAAPKPAGKRPAASARPAPSAAPSAAASAR